MQNTSIVSDYTFDKQTGWRLNLPESVEPGTRTLCLYRVSTAKQLYHDDNNEADIPMQRLRCREYAESQGWTIVCELQEEGISGHKVRAANRDKIQMIKEYAIKKEFDILLVFMFDRIGRIADETPFVMEWLVNQGIHVWSAVEGEQRIESHTDRLLNYIRYWQADGESQKTSIRTANSLHILNEQGYFTGRVCPYGYKLVKSGRMNKRRQEVHDLAICEEEANVIRIIFQMARTYGYGAQSIANRLNALGYKNRSGENWRPATLQSILKNVVYIGILRSGESRSPVQERLRIVDEKTFNDVQAMIEKRSRKYQENRTISLSGRGSPLLSGNIFCGHCGARLCVTTSGKGRKRTDGTDVIRTRYCCQTKTRKHAHCDGQTGYTVHKIDDIIDTFVRSILEKVRAVDRDEVIKRRNQSDNNSLKQHISDLRASYEKDSEQLKTLQSEIIKSLIGESAFTPEMLRAAIETQEHKFAETAKALREAEAKLGENEKNLRELTEKFDCVLEWAAMYDDANLDAKKRVISHIIDRVDVRTGYDIQVTLNISVEQFLNTIELAE